jgi:DNA-binding SARP family transcriptional activator
MRSCRSRILGPVEVLDEHGAPVRLASRRQRLLLAGLAAAEGDVVTVDGLIDLRMHEDVRLDARRDRHDQ